MVSQVNARKACDRIRMAKIQMNSVSMALQQSIGRICEPFLSHLCSLSLPRSDDQGPRMHFSKCPSNARNE
jgi:hypothetical protein